MIAITYRKLGLPVRVVWFNTNSNLQLDGFGIHRIRQSVPLNMIEKHCLIRFRISKTSVVDLSLSEKELFRRLHRTHKNKINRVEKLITKGMNMRIEVNDSYKEFLEMANTFIFSNKYRNPIQFSDLERYIKNKNGELLTLHSDSRLLCGHFYILDPPDRVRVLFGYNNRLMDYSNNKDYSCFMSYLHWYAITRKYKNEGYSKYDLGGINTDSNSAVFGIARFKMGFGGTLLDEYNYEFSSGPLIKGIYRFFFMNS